jgi:aminoglycoside phosphotransferase
LYILEFDNSVKYVLKEKNVKDSGSLRNEAERLKWVNDVIPSPKVISYQMENGKEYSTSAQKPVAGIICKTIRPAS